MKKSLTLAALFSVSSLFAAAPVTNFFWSASYTSNYIRTNILDKLNQVILNSLTTNSPENVTNIVAGISKEHGFLSLVTQQTLPLAVATFGTVTNYDSFSTNNFGYNIADGTLTNNAAGTFNISWQVSLLGANNDAFRVAIFTNGTECILNEAEHTFAATATLTSISGNGIVPLPASCVIQLKMQNAGGNDPTLERVQLSVKK